MRRLKGFKVSKTGWLCIIVPVVVILLIGTGLAVASTPSGIFSKVGSAGQPLTLADFSALPPSVIDGANQLAEEMFGDSPDECQDFVSQLLALYTEAVDKDIVIVFNPGGWGWNLLEDSPGWTSIVEGMEAELEDMSYSLVAVNYKRAVEDWRGQLDDFWGFFTGYRAKARDLAGRTDFLTTYLPDLRVILTGESTGTVITGNAMDLLEENPRVYSIQTGPPFWHHPDNTDHTLVITDNGIAGDALSEGDYLGFIWGCYAKWFGWLEMTGDLGTEPHLVLAPGHDYWWQYPKVGPEITDFLRGNFSPEEIANY